MDLSLVNALTFESLIAFLSLTALEVGLGFDNVAFQGLEVNKLPPEQRKKANAFGMLIAAGLRIAMLSAALAVLSLLVEDFVTIWGHGISGKDVLLFGGGIFLLWHGVKEIYLTVEKPEHGHDGPTERKGNSFPAVMRNIAIINVVFSLDSVLTAVGMGSNFWVMAAAIAVSVVIMAKFSMLIMDFLHKHLSLKLLAISFLLLIGANLCAEAAHAHMNKAFVYGPALYALFLLILNIRAERNREKLVDQHTVSN